MINDVAPRQEERAPPPKPADSSLSALGAISSLCAHWRVPCNPQLLAQRYPVLDLAAVVAALREFGFAVSLHAAKEQGAAPERFPVIALLPSGFVFFGEEAEGLLPACEWIEAALAAPAVKDPDGAHSAKAGFGFSWFARELMRHRAVWRQVLAASLFLQLLALGTPLVTQAIVDKVVVHRTESTLIALAIAMAIGIVFTAGLTWTRQFLILHTGNRVDAVLGAAVFEHLFKLPVAYFERRPTGVIAARLHGVETIREFVASAGVTLVLDIPFLLIAVAVMFFYSVMLTLIVLGVLGVVTIMSALAAPLFRSRLNHQFLLGARNQAFLTEHIAVANSYIVTANALDQCVTLMVLAGGAWLAMNPPPGGPVFTIGMLVAFQMFASRFSQPLMRLVGLWQQFQQAGLAVQRLGDVMAVPPEPYSNWQ